MEATMKTQSAPNLTGKSKTRIIIAFAGLISVANAASAQDIDAFLKQKYEILQQEADANTMRAEAEKRRIESELRRSEAIKNDKREGSSIFSVGNSQTYLVPAGIDALAGTDAATFKMVTGVVLRVSGDFRPDPPTICIAHCQARR